LRAKWAAVRGDRERVRRGRRCFIVVVVMMVVVVVGWIWVEEERCLIGVSGGEAWLFC
jgi:hypothetical protein